MPHPDLAYRSPETRLAYLEYGFYRRALARRLGNYDLDWDMLSPRDAALLSNKWEHADKLYNEDLDKKYPR